MIKTSVFYLQSILSMQPVTVSVSAPVILSVLRDGGQDDRYRKSGKNRHRQPVGFMPHDPGFIPRIYSIRAPLSRSSAFHPSTSSEQHISLYLSGEPLLGLSGEPYHRPCFFKGYKKRLAQDATNLSSISQNREIHKKIYGKYRHFF